MSMTPITLANLSRALNKLKDYFVQIKDAVRTVNNTAPVNGNVQIDRVNFAGDLESSNTQYNIGEYISRSSGGTTPVKSGNAWLVDIKGKAVRTGYVAEVIDCHPVNVDPRPEGSEPLVTSIDKDAFRAAVDSSQTITMLYTTGWSENPADYGVTYTGDPTAGDQIVINYTKKDWGTLSFPTPSTFVSTGWNLYKEAEGYTGFTGYAKVVNYSDTYGFRIEGTYTGIKFSTTLSGTKTDLTMTGTVITGFPDGWTDGYIWVAGGNSTSTAVFMTWSDWTQGYEWTGSAEGEFSGYTASTIDLSSLFGESAPFPYGLLACGSAADEVNLSTNQALSWVERMANTAENRQEAESSGREWDQDDNYIYLVRATPVPYEIAIDGAYTVDDHGMEYFENTTVPVIAQSTYGSSLKNKLEVNVLTIGQQTLSAAEKNQVKQNIDIPVIVYSATEPTTNLVTGMIWLKPGS